MKRLTFIFLICLSFLLFLQVSISIPLEGEFKIIEKFSLFLDKCSKCSLKMYVIPKNISNKQIVENLNIQILSGNCKYKVLYDNYSNPYLFLICKNTNKLELKIATKVKRFYNLYPTNDIKYYRNLEYYYDKEIFYRPQYYLSLNRISDEYILINLMYYLGYVSKNFKYSFNFSKITLPPNKVLYLMQGNCDEIAWLISEIARSFYIPSKYVLGILLSKNNSLFHAWSEIWIKSAWYDIDILAKQYSYVDAYHIYLAEFYAPQPVIETINCSIIYEDFDIKFYEYNIFSEFTEFSSNIIVNTEKNKIIIDLQIFNNLFLPNKFNIRLYLDNHLFLEKSDILINSSSKFDYKIKLEKKYLSPGKHTIKAIIYDYIFNKRVISTYSFILYKDPNIVINSGKYDTQGDVICLSFEILNNGEGSAKNISVYLIFDSEEGFECEKCAVNIPYLSSKKGKIVNFTVKSILPLLPSKILWKLKIIYYSLNGEKFEKEFNIMVFYQENPKEKLIYVILGIIMIVVIVWAINKVRMSV